MYKKSNSSPKKTFIYGTIVIVFLFVAFVILEKSNTIDLFKSTPTDSALDDQGTIVYEDQSEDEKIANDAKKEEIISNVESNPPSKDDGSDSTNNSTATNNVKPIISTWGKNEKGNYEISSFIPGIVENGGTCSLVMKKNGETTGGLNNAQAGPQSTTCGIFEIDKAGLSNGVWESVVTYSSPASKGDSDKVEMEIKL